MFSKEKCCEILGIHPNASFDEAKSAYRHLASILHPDKHEHDVRIKSQSEEKFKRVLAAWNDFNKHYKAEEQRRKEQEHREKMNREKQEREREQSKKEEKRREEEERKYSIHTCAYCGAVNRIPRSKSFDAAKCGTCGESFTKDRRDSNDDYRSSHSDSNYPRKPFEILGITRNISFEDAKLAYRDLILVWHPDKYQSNERLRDKATEQLKAINGAWDEVKEWFARQEHENREKESRERRERERQAKEREEAERTEKRRREEQDRLRKQEEIEREKKKKCEEAKQEASRKLKEQEEKKKREEEATYSNFKCYSCSSDNRILKRKFVSGARCSACGAELERLRWEEEQNKIQEEKKRLEAESKRRRNRRLILSIFALVLIITFLSIKKQQDNKIMHAEQEQQRILEEKLRVYAEKKSVEQEKQRVNKETSRTKQQERSKKLETMMVNVPAGCFKPGGKEVCLDAFRIGKYEVTEGQWERVMGSNPVNSSANNVCGADCPVSNVSYYDITKHFINKLNRQTGRHYRLPTEAEWHYACTSGNNNEYCGSNDVTAVAWHSENTNDGRHPVGQKQPNTFGIYDMSGNVSEWINDWYGDSYPSSSHNPKGAGSSGGFYKVLRGGSYFRDPYYAKASTRDQYQSDKRAYNVGFRLAESSP